MHNAAASFWFHYRQLTPAQQQLADRNFSMLRDDPRHPSLQLKRIG